MAATVRDVAREAGVSPATVSRVLNNYGKVSDSARRRVMTAVRKLQYSIESRESRSANLPSGYKPTVVLLVPSLANPFCGELADGVGEMARTLGYHLMIVTAGYDKAYQLEVIEDLYEQGVEGFLIASNVAFDKHVIDAVHEEYPLVLLTKEELDLVDVHCVVNDDFRGAMLATNHLIELGHQRIAALMVSSHIALGERARGYQTAMEMVGLGEEVHIVELQNEGIEDGYHAALELFRERDFTGIVVHNDILAVGVLKACRKLGKRVPEDVSIVGYDGTMLADVTDPPLTTIVQPTGELGIAGMKLLHELITSHIRSLHRLVLQPSIRIGGSTSAITNSV